MEDTIKVFYHASFNKVDIFDIYVGDTLNVQLLLNNSDFELSHLAIFSEEQFSSIKEQVNHWCDILDLAIPKWE